MPNYSAARTIRAAALLAAVSCLALSVPSFAQQAPATNDAAGDAAEAPQAGGIEDIVVTARRSVESAQTVPIAITTLTSQALRDLNARDIVDIQRVTPGLYIQSSNSGGRARVSIRGQAEADARLTTDGSVGIYIDGVNIPRSVGLRMAMVDLAQVEVLKGPQGTLFGKNTTGGALNITTQQPTYDWGGFVDIQYGSYNKLQATVAANIPIAQDSAALRVVGQVTKRDGYGHFFNGQDANSENTKFGRAQLRLEPASNVSLVLSADYAWQRNDDRVFNITKDTMLAVANTATGALGSIAKQLGLDPTSAADRLTAYSAWKVYFDGYQGGTQNSFANPVAQTGPFHDNFDHFGFASNLKVDLGDVTARSITSYRVLNQEFLSESDGTPFVQSNGPAMFRTRNFSQELQFSSIDGQGLDWQFGGYYSRERGRQTTISNNLPYTNAANATIEDVDAVNISIAGYAQAVMNFTPTFRATGGIRYTSDKRTMNWHNRVDPSLALRPSPATGTAGVCLFRVPGNTGITFPDCNYERSATFKKATWLASVDWRPVRGAMLYASVSTGFRAGGFTQQTSSTTTAAALNAATTPFAPENVTNYEAGFKTDLLDRHLRINGSTFLQKYRDIQVRSRVDVGGVLANIVNNAGKATIYGGELEITAVPVTGLTLNTNFAYLHAAYDEYTLSGVDKKTQPFSSPKWTYNLGATYELPLADGSLRFNANYAYTSAVNIQPDVPGQPLNTYDPASVTQSGYGLLDARIAWKIDSQNIEIAVFGKNITRKFYYISAAVGQTSSANGINFAVPGDPRTFGIELRKTF